MCNIVFSNNKEVENMIKTKEGINLELDTEAIKKFVKLVENCKAYIKGYMLGVLQQKNLIHKNQHKKAAP